MKYCDVMGALFPNNSDSVVSYNDLLEGVDNREQYLLPNLDVGVGEGDQLKVIHTSFVKYPIIGEGPGNKWSEDTYTPWHGLWNKTESGLGRSVREFGGASYDAWIGYIHGGGESYSKGLDNFRESDRKWYPRGYDLAPSENAMFYAIGKNLFKGSFRGQDYAYTLLFNIGGHEVYNDRTAHAHNLCRFKMVQRYDNHGYAGYEAFVDYKYPFPKSDGYSDWEYWGGYARPDHGWHKGVTDCVIIPSDVNFSNQGTLNNRLRNTMLFVGSIDNHIGWGNDGVAWGHHQFGASFVRILDDPSPDGEDYHPLSPYDEADTVYKSEYHIHDYGDLGIYTAEFWRRSDNADYIVMAGNFYNYEYQHPPENPGLSYAALVWPKTSGRTIYSIGEIEKTSDVPDTKIHKAMTYDHPDLGHVVVLAGKFKRATTPETKDHDMVTGISAAGPASEYYNMAFVGAGATSFKMYWACPSDTPSGLNGPSNLALYKSEALWEDWWESTDRALDDDWDGDPILGMEVFDVSNNDEDHIIACGTIGIKYYDATNQTWMPLETAGFHKYNSADDGIEESYDPFNAGDDFYGTIFSDLQVVDATNGDKHLFMVGNIRTDNGLWSLWKWRNDEQHWSLHSHNNGTSHSHRGNYDTLSTYDSGEETPWYAENGDVPIIYLSQGRCSESYYHYGNMGRCLGLSTERMTYTDADFEHIVGWHGPSHRIPYNLWATPHNIDEKPYIKAFNEISYSDGSATGYTVLTGFFQGVGSWSIDYENFSTVSTSFQSYVPNNRPWNYIRNDDSMGGGTNENAVPLQNVHSFTDTVDYNAAVVTGYMSPFWSALEEKMSSVSIDENDPVGSQLQRFLGTQNRVTQDEDGNLKFEDVWDYARWSVEAGGDLGINNVGASANVPRLILETSRKIFNNGKIFEVHFAPATRRSVLNATEHYTHFVGYNGYYVTGLYNEDTAEYEWKSEDVFRVFDDNPLDIDPALHITSISFADNIHVTDKKGVITFKDSEETYEDTPEGKSYQWAFYPRKPIVREGTPFDANDIELFAQQAANIDPSDQQLIRQSMDFRPEEAENWRPLDFGVGLNIEPIFNDSAVTTDEDGVTRMWLCGDNGMIIRSKWNDKLTNEGEYIGFSNFAIQNIDNAYARRKSIKNRLWTITDLAQFAATDYDITDLVRFIAGQHEVNQNFDAYPSVTAVKLNSIFFIGKDTATEDGQIGKYGWAVGEQGTVLFTKDAGNTWTKTRLIDSKENIVTWAEFARDWNNGDVDITDLARLASQWDNREISCRKVVFYDIENGFITTDRGIFKTSDGGMTWHVDKNSLTVGLTREWTDIVALPERYRLWNQTLMPKVFALNPVTPNQAVDWHSNGGKSTYYHKSTMGISGMPLEIEVGSKEIAGTPYTEDRKEWPDPFGSSDELPSKENLAVRSTYRRGYTFYPSSKMSLHLYDPARHIRGDL